MIKDEHGALYLPDSPLGPQGFNLISAPAESNMMTTWERQNDLRLEDDLGEAIHLELGGFPGRSTAVARQPHCPIDLFSLESVDSMSKDSSILLKSQARNIAMSWDEGSSEHVAPNRPKTNINEDDLLSLASTVDTVDQQSSVVMQQHMRHIQYDPEVYNDGGVPSIMPGTNEVPVAHDNTLRFQHASLLSGTAQRSSLRATNDVGREDQECVQENEIQRLSQAEEEARQEAALWEARWRDDFASRESADVQSTLLENLRGVLLQTMNEQHNSLKEEVCELRRQMQAGQLERETHVEKLMRLAKENEVLRNTIARGTNTPCMDKGVQCTMGSYESNKENEGHKTKKAAKFPLLSDKAAVQSNIVQDQAPISIPREQSGLRRTPLRTIANPVNSLVSPEKIIGSLNKKGSSLVNEIASLRSKLSSFEPSSPSKVYQSTRNAEIRSSSDDVIENLRSAMNAAKEVSASIATPTKDRGICYDPTDRLRLAPSQSIGTSSSGDDLMKLAREIDALITKTEMSDSPHHGKSCLVDTTMETIPLQIDEENEVDTFIVDILDSFDREFSFD